MIVLAIDPGPVASAFVRYDDRAARPIDFAKVDNSELLPSCALLDADHLAVEMIASYGMAVGAEVFSTCLWIGRFVERWSRPHTLVYRREVKLHLCGAANAKDANIRQALIDRFGPGKERAIGRIKTRGPLYGVSGDVWSALAVAVTFADRQPVG